MTTASIRNINISVRESIKNVEDVEKIASVLPISTQGTEILHDCKKETALDLLTIAYEPSLLATAVEEKPQDSQKTFQAMATVVDDLQSDAEIIAPLLTSELEANSKSEGKSSSHSPIDRDVKEGYFDGKNLRMENIALMALKMTISGIKAIEILKEIQDYRSITSQSFLDLQKALADNRSTVIQNLYEQSQKSLADSQTASSWMGVLSGVLEIIAGAVTAVLSVASIAAGNVAGPIGFVAGLAVIADGYCKLGASVETLINPDSFGKNLNYINNGLFGVFGDEKASSAMQIAFQVITAVASLGASLLSTGVAAVSIGRTVVDNGLKAAFGVIANGIKSSLPTCLGKEVVKSFALSLFKAFTTINSGMLLGGLIFSATNIWTNDEKGDATPEQRRTRTLWAQALTGGVLALSACGILELCRDSYLENARKNSDTDGESHYQLIETGVLTGIGIASSALSILASGRLLQNAANSQRVMDNPQIGENWKKLLKVGEDLQRLQQKGSLVWRMSQTSNGVGTSQRSVVSSISTADMNYEESRVAQRSSLLRSRMKLDEEQTKAVDAAASQAGQDLESLFRLISRMNAVTGRFARMLHG